VPVTSGSRGSHSSPRPVVQFCCLLRLCRPAVSALKFLSAVVCRTEMAAYKPDLPDARVGLGTTRFFL